MSTREIILMRHAHAGHGKAGQADIDRTLSPRGEAEAEAAGIWIKTHVPPLARALCSPAQRTRQTLAGVLDQTGYVEAAFESAIYDATPGVLIDLLAAQPESASPLLLVGHNPGLEQLLALLTEGASDAGRGMPTSSVARLALPLEAPVEPGVARLLAFWFP
ncbi:MAG TPA: histidine phosphatase family protein [Xanthomonadaceae bacterium]|nr:histidine phosphatase family protein [Xanthomonadaceae bacterium]